MSKTIQFTDTSTNANTYFGTSEMVTPQPKEIQYTPIKTMESM